MAFWNTKGPKAPTALIATAASSSQINLSWTDNSTDEAGFKIDRSPDGSTGWTTITTTAANVVAYSDSASLSMITTYYYRIYALSSSGYSNIANATTLVPTPTGFTASSGYPINLNWNDISVTSYVVVRGPAGSNPTLVPVDGTGYTTGQVVGSDTVVYAGSVFSASDTTGVSKSTYYYKIYARAGATKYSAAASTSAYALNCGALAAGGTWVLVPGDSVYGTNPFCVQKYEASNVGGLPKAQAGVAPWAYITQSSAISACTSLGAGYHLITNPEWMTVAANIARTGSNWTGGRVGSGELIRGNSDNYSTDINDNPNPPCRANANDAYAWVTPRDPSCTNSLQGGLALNQRRTHSLSSGSVIWDIAGNVGEWVNYYNLNDKPSTAFNVQYSAIGAGSATTPRSHIVPQQSTQSWWNDGWNSVQGIGMYYGGANGSGGCMNRGGSYSDWSATGVFTIWLNMNTSFSNFGQGFRCAY